MSDKSYHLNTYTRFCPFLESSHDKIDLGPASVNDGPLVDDNFNETISGMFTVEIIIITTIVFCFQSCSDLL